MKRKRLLSLLMTSVLVITSAGQTAVVSGADFTDTAVYEDIQAAETTAEEQQPETDISEVQTDIEEVSAEPEEAVVQEAEPETEIFEDTSEDEVFEDETDTEIWSAGEEEIFTSGDEEVFASGEVFREGEEYYDYQLPDWGVQLPRWEIGIDKYFNCYVENPQYPDGADISVEITELTVENDADSEDAVSCTAREDGNGWDLHMNHMGHAVVTMAYNQLDGTPAEVKRDIWIGGEVYGMSVDPDTGTNQLLPGYSLNLTADVWLDCYNPEEDRHFQGDVSNVTVEWSCEEGQDAVTVTQNTENPKECLVEANSDAAGRNARIVARAYIPGEEGQEPAEVISQDFELYINEGYYQLFSMVTAADGSELGKDVSELAPGERALVTPELRFIQVDNPAGEIVNGDIQYSWRWDENAVEIVDADEKVLNGGEPYGTAPFTLKKIQNWDTNLKLIAEVPDENGNYFEADRYYYDLRSLDYGVWFEELRNGEDYNTWIYADEDLTLRLNTDNFPEGYQAEWIVGRYDEAEDVVKPFEGAAALYETAKDGSSITLHGAALKALGEEAFRDDGWFNVDVRISIDGVEVSGDGMGVQLRDSVYDYDYYGDDVLLPGQDFWIGNRMGVNYENSAEPWGMYEETAVTDVSIVEQKTWDENGEEIVMSDIVSWDGNAEEGWNIRAVTYGYAKVEVSYTPVNGDKQPGTYRFTLWINSDKWGLELTSSTGDDRLLPGAGLDLTADIWHQCYEYGRGEFPGETNVELAWEGSEGYEDVFSFEQDAESPEICHITAREDVEDGNNASITARAYLLDENGNREKDDKGNDIEVAGREFWINITNRYFSITPAFLEKHELAVGETAVIAPQLWDNYRDKQGENISDEITENIRYRWEWNPDAVEITDGTGKVLAQENEDGQDSYGEAPFTVRKLKNWQEDIRIIAELPDEDGSYNEIARYEWPLWSVDYYTYVENLREENYSWIFPDEEQILELNKEHLEGREIEAEWQLGVWNEETETLDPIATDAVLFTQDKNDATRITLHGAALAENRNQLRDGCGFDIRIIIRAGGEEVFRTAFGMNLSEPDYQWSEYDSDEIIGSKVFYEDNEMWCWVTNSSHPYGERVKAVVKNIVSSDEKAVSCYQDPDNENFWTVDYIGAGEADISYTMELDGQELGFSVHKNTADEVWRMWLDLNPRWNTMLPNAALKIVPTIYRYTLEGREVAAEADYKITYDVGNTDLLTVDNGVIHSNEKCGYADVLISVSIPRGEEEPYTIEGRIPVWIEEEYTSISVKDISVEPGSTISIEALQAAVKVFNRETPDGTVLNTSNKLVPYVVAEKGLLTINESGDAFQVTDAFTEQDEPVQTGICVEASWTDENGAEQILTAYANITICAHKWDSGKVTAAATCTSAGQKVLTCDKCGSSKTVAIPAVGHKWGAWQTISNATVFAKESQKRTCAVCGETETRTVGSKLTPILKVTATNLPMKVGQKITSYKVTMANGDSVVSWKCDKTKIVKVSGKPNGTCTLTAQKNTGSAKITITLKSGMKKVVTVKVQKSDVKTEKINGIAKKATLQKGKKLTLKPVIVPISSKEKVKYTSSNKKVVTVSSKGVVKGVNPGTATITVKSGKGKATCKITVPGITGVKATVSLKKGKSTTLKAKLLGASGKITYSSSNSNVVTVSSKGKLTAKKKGKATITIKAGNYSYKCKVTVK